MRSSAALLIVLLAVVSCAPDDPWLQLAQSRSSIDVELRNWVESALPAAETPPAADADDDDATDAAAPVIEPHAAPPSPRDAHLSILVIDRGAILPLECLTVDIVFETGEGESAREVGRIVRELDISRLRDAGGGLDVVLRVALPDEPVSAIGVARRPASLEELAELCEAEVLPSREG